MSGPVIDRDTAAALMETFVAPPALLMTCYTALGDREGATRAARMTLERAEAVLALLRIRSRANSRSSGLGLSSSTSSPLTMAPTGLMRSWQTREHNSAASSRASGAGPGDEVPDIRYSQGICAARTKANHACLLV